MGAMKKVFGIAGMPGAGKTTAVEAAMQFGAVHISMGDVVRAEAAKRGLENTRDNMARLMVELRTEYGNGIIAKRCLEQIDKTSSPTIVIDGLRSYLEVEIFREKNPGFTIIAIHARPAIRYDRLRSRGRSDDPKDWKMFSERDEKEINIGIAKVIALADEIIVNEDSITELSQKMAHLFTDPIE